MAFDSPFARRAMVVVWPSFLVAALAEGVFFTVFDPFDLHFFGAPLDWSRLGVYTMGFFGFWGLGMASSAFTLFLERGAGEINRGGPPPDDGAPYGAPRPHSREKGRG